MIFRESDGATSMTKVVALYLSFLSAVGPSNALTPSETYAIQNVQTGKNVRPFRAKKWDGNAIILYDHWSWKCMTWQLVPSDEGAYQLRNRYTGRSFSASDAPMIGGSLSQNQKDDDGPAWEFIEAPGEGYWIRLRGSDLYLTISSPETNSAIILMPLTRTDTQRWRFVPQDPWF